MVDDPTLGWLLQKSLFDFECGLKDSLCFSNFDDICCPGLSNNLASFWVQFMLCKNEQKLEYFMRNRGHLLPHNFPPPCVLLHLAGRLLLGPRPLAYTCHHGNSGQLVGREPSAGVLRAWHCMCVGQIILVLKLALRQSGWPISFSGKEAVKQRVSCCLGWVRGSCSPGTRTGLYRHGCFGLSGWLAEERREEIVMMKRDSGWGISMENKFSWEQCPLFQQCLDQAKFYMLTPDSCQV